MKTLTPLEAIEQLVEARNRGDIEAAIRFYETDATLVAQPGVSVRGEAAIREALARFIALRPTFNVTAREIIQAGSLALHCSQWTLNGSDPEGKPFQMTGRTADILRKQQDGNWLVALDNPWGTAILG